MYLIRYDELALKGQNRRIFEKQLIANIRHQLKDCAPRCERLWGRIFLSGHSEQREESIREKLKKIFGIASFSPIVECAPDLEEIKKRSLELLHSCGLLTAKSFRVTTNRVDKRFPLTSQDTNIEIANFLLPQFPMLSVNLTHPDLELGIEIRQEGTFLYLEKEKGLCGLPVGTGGSVLTLLSGGIDSPVAAYLMMKRGCTVGFIHFYSYPYTGEQSKEKVIELAKTVTQYQHPSRLFLISFSKIQEEIAKHSNERFRTVLYRRAMQRIATAVAQKNRYKALVTGESLGQVASQTLGNLSTISQSTDILILRPLVAFNKQETVNLAKHIGTFDISIRPFDDCCTLFQPKNPATQAKLSQVLMEEEKIPSLPSLIEEAIEQSEVIQISSSPT
ncbi:MAG: tRNA 4-thiouridine(8) synthase ThiI [Deltaproteobacteria bacterium GWA2_38_16]|nr:MAG: tRNA 4-thiouridine(8) synthase ThiI [Deltaproteobacteria bacterium GWA2_38_16]OGQ02639.1 MAG: tRNA 4-thiouridine(8) synthase ThiI [Deltaproteobacteria bacterium RIFCSPHIGHO2_02_FULL_38_15]OGQ30352.1 MAG: tRNA 4-thiouridine(8) synthase ThiI [Deltaproteobacteria bacterium RIFCSPLOWO2_01_FULL_38_9]